MGFLSKLGNIAGLASFAIPAVGPALGMGLKAATAAGGILGAASKLAPGLAATAAGRAEGRATDATFQQRQDQINQQRYGNVLNRADTELAQKKYALSAPQSRADNSVRGDVLANVRDFSYGAPKMVGNIPVPTSTGGRRPSILSDNTRALGALTSSDALKSQQSGDSFAPIENVPSLTPLPHAGAFDKVLTTAGTIGSLAPSFLDILHKYKRPGEQGYTQPSDTTGWA